MEKKKTSNKTTKAVKKTQPKLNLGKLIPKLGTLPVSERDKVLRAWWKAYETHMSQNIVNGPFNPTSMDEKTLRNFACYLQLTIIDKYFGIQRDFVPTQDYKQEVDREFRNRGLSHEAKLDAKLAKKEQVKIDKREEDIMDIANFFDQMYGFDFLIKYPIINNKKDNSPAKVTRLW